MPRASVIGVGVLGITLLLPGCALLPAGEGGSNAVAPGRSGSALVLSGEQLRDRRTDMLSVLSEMSAVRVTRSGQCPTITMRGQKTYMGSTDPSIYVNGTQAGNTCLLEMMSTEDVERVEVYPMGVTSRPAYTTNPNGLILLFLRSGEPDPSSLD